MTDTENPYQSPGETSQPSPEDEPNITLLNVLRAFLLWCCVCAVSAIPSFVLGMNVANYHYEMVAMGIGILIFAVGYTAVDLSFLRQLARRNPAIRRTLFIAYIGRMTLSAIFPAGMMLDMWPGLISVIVVEALFGQQSDVPELGNFAQVLVTTLFQGVLMNAVLLAAMLPIYGFCRMLGIPNHRPELMTAPTVALEANL